MDTSTDCSEMRVLFSSEGSRRSHFYLFLFTKRCVDSEAIQLAAAQRSICEAASRDPKPSDQP